MLEELPENIRKLADTLIKSGLATSQSEAIEKATATLEAQKIVEKGQSFENKTVNEILGEDAPPADEQKVEFREPDEGEVEEMLDNDEE